jgi:hypothetical protein
MYIASRVFLPAAFAAGLLLPCGAHAGLEQGFLIDLGTPADPLTLDWSAAGGLKAAAAPANGKPALELPRTYSTTLAGTYDVIDDLGSLDKTKKVFWQEHYEIMLNGHVILGGGGVIGPESGEDIWLALVDTFAQFISKDDQHAAAILSFLIGFLEQVDSAKITTPTGTTFDYGYNTKGQPSGTFAVGTNYPLGEKILLNATNTLSLDFSAFVVPEPSTWAMMLLGFAGVGLAGYRGRRAVTLSSRETIAAA